MAWDRTAPAASAALASAPVRGNFQSLDSLSWKNLMDDPYPVIWPAGSSAAPADWTLSGTGASCSRDITNYKFAGMAAKITMGSATSKLTKVLMTAIDPGLKGRVISWGVWVYTATASLARVGVDDGVTPTYTSYHTGGGSFEWLTKTMTIDASATKLDFILETNIGGGAGNATFSGICLVLGPVPPQFFLQPDVSEGVLYFPTSGNLSTGTDKFRFINGRPFIVRNVTLKTKTAPTTQAWIVDVNQWDGSAYTSMYSTRPQVAASANLGGANPDSTYQYRCFTGQKNNGSKTNAELNVDFDQVGSGTVGADAEVLIRVLSFPKAFSGLEAF